MPPNPHHKIHVKIVEFMKDKNLWELPMKKELPKKYEKYGDLILFSPPAFSCPNWKLAGDELWELISQLYRVKNIGLKHRISDDNFRTPNAKLVYGNNPVTNFNDNGVKYSWNIEKLMFSAGNIKERHRISNMKCNNQVVVDLFAGIGYFTLPYLVHAEAEFVHACEWNPDAVEALKKNLEINKVSDKCEVHEGDNREVCPRDVADIVNVGLIPSSADYWKVAAEALKPTGGVLFIHENITSNVSTKPPEPKCQECINILKGVAHLKKPSNSGKFRVIEISKRRGILMLCGNHDLLLNFNKLEWFYFALHVSHTLSSCLEKFRPNDWSVSVREGHKVKSYAPHIDHCVFTVHCFPCEY